MTDNEIIKALGCCVRNGYYQECDRCPLEARPQCEEVLFTGILDIINRLEAQKVWLENEIINRNNTFLKVKTQLFSVEAENDRLKANEEMAEIEDYKALYENLKAEHIETIKAIKNVEAETVKEFAERLKARYREHYRYDDFRVRCLNIHTDNLVKEMVGEQK